MKLFLIRKKVYVIALLCLFSLGLTYGQEDVVIPSPDVMAMRQFGNTPIDYSTGKPGISIPIYTITQGELSVPISLSYDSSGIRVAQEATPVGLGWVLSAGGVVSRDIRGNYYLSPVAEGSGDDFVNYLTDNTIWDVGSGKKDLSLGSYNFYRAGFLYTFPNSGYTGDHEPDTFHYNFAGYNGQFILKRDGSVLKSNEEDGVKIELINVTTSPPGLPAAQKGFRITTPQGIQYTFTEHEIQQVSAWSPAANVTAWHLTSMRSVSSGTQQPSDEEITFHYQAHNYTTNESPSELMYHPSLHTPVPGPLPGSLSFISKSYNGLIIDHIDFKHGRVKFDYAQDRTDLLGSTAATQAKRLTKISVLPKVGTTVQTNNPIKEFTLDNNHYFNTTQSHDPLPSNFAQDNPASIARLYKRLKLKGVTEDNLPPYQFSYYNDNANAFCSKVSRKQDYWGFYNGKNNNTYLAALKNPIHNADFQGADKTCDPIRIKDFTLEKIVYPTGGATKFEFEAHTHTYTYDQSLRMFNEALWKVPTPNTNTGAETLRHDHLLAYGDPILYPFFNLSFSGSRTVNCNIIVRTKRSLKDEFSSASTNEGYIILPNNTLITLSSIFNEAGGNTLTYGKSVSFPYVSGGNTEIAIGHNDINVVTVSYSISTGTQPPSPWRINPMVYGGGLRIKKITDYKDDGINVSQTRNFEYHENYTRPWDGVTEEHSTGTLAMPPVFSDIFDFYDGVSTPPKRPIRRTSGQLVHSLHPGVVYGSVSVTGTGGKTKYTYNNDGDLFPEPIGMFNGVRLQYFIPGETLPYKPRIFYETSYGLATINPLRGKLLEQETFKSLSATSFRRMTQQKYTYKEVIRGVVLGAGKRNWMPNAAPTIGVSFRYGYNPFYVAMRNRTALVESIEDIHYKDHSPHRKLTKNTTFYYDNDAHSQANKIVETTSDGKELVTHTLFPMDYSTSAGAPFIEAMQTNNIIKPIETVSYQRTAGSSNNELISGSALTYYDSGSSLGRLKDVKPMELSSSKALTSFKFSNRTTSNSIPPSGSNSGFVLDSSVYPNAAEQTYVYDDIGNITEITHKSGKVVSYIYGYKKAYPIAKIENATYAQIASQVASLQSLSNADDDTCLDSGSCDEKTLRASLNSLRDLPALSNAMITTYTYDPLIGITSITDPKGQTVYYQYDTLNRLQYVRDFQGHILKEHKYNYKN